MAEKTPAKKSDKPKKEYKDYSSLRAWQVGHDLNMEAYAVMQEYRSAEDLRPWCDHVTLALRDSVVQVMEAFRKYPSYDKLKRYEACQYYLNQALYTLYLGDKLGLWEVDHLIKGVEEYQNVARASAYYFVKELKEKGELSD